MFQKNCIDNISSKSQKRQRLIAFILVDTIQYPCTLQNNIYHSNKRIPPTFFNSDTNPVCGHLLIHSFGKNPCSGCNSGTDLVVALEYTFFQIYSNAKQISVKLASFTRIYAKRCRAVVLTNCTSYVAFLLDLQWAVQSGHGPFLQLLVPDDSVFV